MLPVKMLFYSEYSGEQRQFVRLIRERVFAARVLLHYACFIDGSIVRL